MLGVYVFRNHILKNLKKAQPFCNFLHYISKRRIQAMHSFLSREEPIGAIKMEKQKADSIITEYLPKVYGFAVKKCYSYDEAEELCAEIVKEAYLSLLKAKELINVEGYLWRISEHTYAKYVSLKKKHEGISIDEMQIPFFDIYSVELPDDEIRKLRREIAFLTEKRRRIVYCFYYEDKSISAIAEEMGIPEGTVKWHLNKARHELKEGFSMERKIGKLGLQPIEALNISHSGNVKMGRGPEYYLSDKINLNIVYSVYDSPKTKEEIAEELGITPVYLEDKIDFLEGNGFLVRTAGSRYTTYVLFLARTYSLELWENKLKLQRQAAELLAKEYVPTVREAMEDVRDVYIPSGRRELFEAAAIFYGVANKGCIAANKDLSNYFIQTTEGERFIASINLGSKQSDEDYIPSLKIPDYSACGNMWRGPGKYLAVTSWAVDTRYSSREGMWKNNKFTDYDYIYEILTGAICEDAANADKFSRLRERKFLTDDGRINIMVLKGTKEEFDAKVPALPDNLKEKFANAALELAMNEAKNYPPQMQDLIVSWGVEGFISNVVALMLMDILYTDGTFAPLTEQERVTSNLIMFSDRLPENK